MPPTTDMFALLIWSIISFIQAHKAANACTIVDVFTELADKRLPNLAKHLFSNAKDLRSDFTVGHSSLTMPDVPYAHIVALEQNGVLSTTALNDLLCSTGFCNMAFKGKFVCFKVKYLGVAPASHDNLHDDVSVFVLRITDNTHDLLGDVLLFCANAINVLGVEPGVFKSMVRQHWSSLTSQDKHAFKHSVPKFKVGECNWLLTPEQEQEIILKGISEVPESVVFQDAARLHRYASQVSIQPITNTVTVTPVTTISSTVNQMISVLQSTLNGSIKAFESILLFSCEAIIYDPRYLTFIQFKDKPEYTFADCDLLIMQGELLYNHTISVSTGGNLGLLMGTFASVKQSAKNLQSLLQPPVVPVPAFAPMIEEPMSLGSLGSMMKLLEDLPTVEEEPVPIQPTLATETSFERLMRQIPSPVGGLMAESSLERILGTMSPDFGFVSRENSLDRFMRPVSRQNSDILISPRALLPPRHPDHKRQVSRAASVVHNIGKRVTQFMTERIAS